MRIATNIRGIGAVLGVVLAVLAVSDGYAASSGAVVDGRVADAAMRGDKAAVRSLVSQHAEVNSTQSDGSTALLWAVRQDDRETTTFLLSHGAAVNAANHYGVTALSLAAANGSAAMVEALLAAGADANAASPEGETELMRAARSGNADVVKQLLDHGANVNAKESWEQETALMYAAAENHPEVVRLLIARGADVNAYSRVLDPKLPRPKYTPAVGIHFLSGGLTAMLFAARQGASEPVRLLVEGKADMNLGDPGGITPMIEAIMNAQFDVAALLLEKGADPNAVDKAGRGALYAAVDMHRLERLFSRPAPRSSSKLDSDDIVKLLLEKGANPNARLTKRVVSFQHDTPANSNLNTGATPFMKAASASDVAMMRLLLDHGADPNITNENKTTPLMAAAGLKWNDVSSLGSESDSIEAIKLCLEHGSDVNAVNKQRETALHGAAERGADSVVSFLVSKGARLDAKTEAGRTPLDEAIGQGGDVKDESDARRPERVSTEVLLRKLMSQSVTKLSIGTQASVRGEQ